MVCPNLLESKQLLIFERQTKPFQHSLIVNEIILDESSSLEDQVSKLYKLSKQKIDSYVFRYLWLIWKGGEFYNIFTDVYDQTIYLIVKKISQ